MIPAAPPRLSRDAPASPAENAGLQNRPLLTASLALLTALGAVVAAGAISAWRLPVPPCVFKQITGLPCPLCGSTRSFISLSRLDLQSAFFWNPLTLIVCAGIAAWFVLVLAETLLNRKLAVAPPSLRNLPLGWLILLAILANWIYLAFTLPR